MSGPVHYPAVPLDSRNGEAVGEVTVDPRNGAMAAIVAGRPFAARPPAGKRRSLDTGFLELRKTLRRAGYGVRACGTCQHFRFSEASRAMSAGFSGYCGLGHHELGGASLGTTGVGGSRPPVVTLFFSCPDWAGRDERELADVFARQEGTR